MDMNKFPKTGQRLTISTLEDDIYNQENQAIPANAEDLEKDELGFTNPNLHRRIRENVLQDGKKVYTIIEHFTTGNPWEYVSYTTKYPIASIKYVYIAGSSVRKVPGLIVPDWLQIHLLGLYQIKNRHLLRQWKLSMKQHLCLMKK